MLIYIVVLVGMLHWVHRTDQVSVRKTPETTRRIWSRLAIVAGCLLLGCYFLDVAFWIVAVLACVMVLLAMTGELLGIVGLPLIALGYVIKEFVMGFPELVLEPAEQHPTRPGLDHKHAEFIGRCGVVVSPMRPSGEIEVDGVLLQAKSEGKMIDKGTTVRVTRLQGGTLVVRESSGEEQGDGV